MSDRKIEDATYDTEITGTEKFPIDDGGIAKYTTSANIKDFVISNLVGTNSTQSVSLDNDGIYIVHESSIKKLNAKVLAQAVLDYGLSLAGVVDIDGNEIIGVKDANVKKTITVDGLAEYIKGKIGDITLNIEEFNLANAAGGDDLLVVSQSGSEKKISLTNIRKFALDGLYAYATEKTDSVGDNDFVFIYSGSTVKKVKKSDFLGNNGNVVSTASFTIEDAVPVWGASNNTIKGSMTVAQHITENSSYSQLPSASAVYEAITDAVGSTKKVNGPSSTTFGKIPTWSTQYNTLEDGKVVRNSIRENGTADNDSIPTEKAVRDAIVTPNVFSVGTNGLVPAPSASDSNKVLCGDGTWKAITTSSGSGTSTSYSDFTGASSSQDGSHGLVPAPEAGDNNKFLRGDGTWATVSGGGGSTSYYDTIYIPAGAMTPSATNGAETDTVSLGSGSTTKTNDVVVFAGGATEYVEFCFDIPDDFDSTGGMKIKLFWSSNSSSASFDTSVVFKVGSTLAYDGSGLGPNPFSSSWASATDTFNGTGALYVTEAVDVNPLGFSGQYLRIIISRDATDTMEGDALLLGAKLQYKRTMQGEAW